MYILWLCVGHKGIRYIEWYRDYLMTIRRQLFCSSAIVERIRTPSPPPNSPSPRGPPPNHRAGFDDLILPRQAIGRFEDSSTWGALDWNGGGEVGKGPFVEICRATEELAPNRHQIISVPLYIPYSFMVPC